MELQKAELWKIVPPDGLGTSLKKEIAPWPCPHEVTYEEVKHA